MLMCVTDTKKISIAKSVDCACACLFVCVVCMYV